MQVIASNKLNAAINSVVKAGAKFSGQLHTVAYSCLAHVDASGDVRPLQRLYDNMGGKVTKAAIAAWAKAFGKVKVATDEETGVVKFAYNKAAKGDLEGAAACPVLDFKPESAGAKGEFDFAAKLAALLKAAEKAGAHLQHVKAYQLVAEAEAVLNGGNVVTVATSKEGTAKNKAKAKAEKVAA
jgi:hypothetical protein